jgi:hypothetical protein
VPHEGGTERARDAPKGPPRGEPPHESGTGEQSVSLPDRSPACGQLAEQVTAWRLGPSGEPSHTAQRLIRPPARGRGRRARGRVFSRPARASATAASSSHATSTLRRGVDGSSMRASTSRRESERNPRSRWTPSRSTSGFVVGDAAFDPFVRFPHHRRQVSRSVLARGTQRTSRADQVGGSWAPQGSPVEYAASHRRHTKCSAARPAQPSSRSQLSQCRRRAPPAPLPQTAFLR